MTKCKDKKTDIIVGVFGGVNGDIFADVGGKNVSAIKGFDVKTVSTYEIAQGEMKSLVQNTTTQTKTIIPPEKRNIVFQKKDLIVNKRAYAVGKRAIIIENNSFGPPAEQRQGPGINLTPDGTEIKDNFRYRSGKYWTTDDTGKELIFLAGKVKGEPWSVVDWNFTNSGILRPDDITVVNGLREEVSQNSIDRIITKIQKNQSMEVGSVFATQQWILIKANSPYYTMRAEGSNNATAINTSQIGSLSFSSLTPQIAQSDKYNTSNLQFNSLVWAADLRGGNVTANTPYAESVSDVSFVPTIAERVDFYDHSFECPLPFNQKEVEGFNNYGNSLMAQIKSTYNFFVKKYETVLGFATIPEQVLPNLYAMVSEFIQESNNQEFKDHITLGGIISMKDAPSLKPSRRGEKRKIGAKKTTTQYFEKLAYKFEELQRNLPLEAKVDKRKQQAFRGLTRSQIEKKYTKLFQPNASEQARLLEQRKIISKLENNFTNILFPMNNTQLIKDYHDKKYMFPMYVDLEFSTDKTTVVAEILKQSSLSVALQQRIVNGVIKDIGVEKKTFVDVTELLQKKRIKISGQPTQTTTSEFSFDTEEHRTWDITEWLEDFEKVDDIDQSKRSQARILSNIEDVSVSIGPPTVDDRAAIEPNAKFLRSLMKLIFVGKLRKLVKDKMRTYEEMMSGKLAYSETVLYRVEKLLSNDDGTPGAFIQNFFLPNSNEIDVMKFVDTQIKYNRRYLYRVYAYQVVIGTKYNYSNLNVEGDIASFLVNQFPSIKMIEIPYFESYATIIDDPPVFPEIEVIPYRAISDKVLFFLRSGIGEYADQPIIIDSKDKEKIIEIRKAKDLEENEPLTFRSDDHTGKFQIFRMTEKPKSYKDFEGKMLKEVETDISKISLQSATSAAYLDDIKPNTKYYYIFRIIDVHGHISNPTRVYEIEMIDERGAVFPSIKVVDFEEKVQRMSSRTMRRFIQIKPALVHTLINEEKTGIQNAATVKDTRNVALGLKDESVWNKKFKIRLTSKSTGRKIDFNVDFQTKTIQKIEVDEQ